MDLVGVLTAPNALERIRGITAGIKGSKVKLETFLAIDLQDEAQAYLKAGVISVAIGQRLHFFGVISVLTSSNPLRY